MPQPLLWNQLKSQGSEVAPRFGHTLTNLGNFYILFGGVEKKRDPHEKTSPTNEVYSLRIDHDKCTWTKEQCVGDIPLPRAHHSACALPGDRLFIFGGFYSSKLRLNDAFIFHYSKLTWKAIPTGNMITEPKNEPSPIGAPSPRGNHSCCYLEGKVYIFGGHGGVHYERKNFNDLYSFDLETQKWEHLPPENIPPDPRSGHSMFGIGNKVYIFGGWNHDSQFGNLMYFDLDTNNWVDPEIPFEIPTWNHGAIMVEAIPSWKYFIFGGMVGQFGEGQERSVGQYSNKTFFLDIEGMRWQQVEVESEPGKTPVLPITREYGSLIYDKRDSRIIVFGGFHNTWLNDVHALNVGIIVGPPYAIMSIEPNLGQLSGGSKVIIKGIGFSDVSNINVRFSTGKNSVIVQGTYVSDTELSCITPSFEEFGAKDAEVRLQIKSGDYTITSSLFHYFMNTRAHKSLAYGPGILENGLANVDTEFLIQARNDLNENRISGRDVFEVRILTVEEDDSVEPTEIKSEIDDLDNGSYIVKYKVQKPMKVKVEIKFLNEKEKLVSIRGSPYYATFTDENLPESTNTLTGKLMKDYIKFKLDKLENFMKNTTYEISTQDKNIVNDVKALLKVKEHIEKVQDHYDRIVLDLDEVDECLKLFDRNDMAKDQDLKKIKKLFDQWNNLQKQSKETKKEIEPIVKVEAEKSSKQIIEFENKLKNYQIELKKREFFFFDTGVTVSMQKMEEVEKDLEIYEGIIEDYKYNSRMFGYPEIIENSENIVKVMKNDLKNMTSLWKHIDECFKIFETYLDTPWLQTAPFEMEEDVKKLNKRLQDIKVDRKNNSYLGIYNLIKNWLKFLPLVGELHDEAMRDRHWEALKKDVQKDFEVDEALKLKTIYDANLIKFADNVTEIAEQAKQEAKMEKILNSLEVFWKGVVFELHQHKNTSINILKMNEDDFEKLEENQVQVQNMFASRFLATWETRVVFWQKSLAAVSEVIQLLAEVQKTWTFLENLFIHSEEVKKELPKESEKFVDIDIAVKDILKKGESTKNIQEFCNQEDIMGRLEKVQSELAVCEKALNEFLDGKKRAFPRFYFVATLDLLDILANGNSPKRIMDHMPKIFQAIRELKLEEGGEGERPKAVGMQSNVGVEYVDFTKPLQLLGKVEVYLQYVIDLMQKTLRDVALGSVKNHDQKERKEWLLMDPTQITLLINLIKWVEKVEATFLKLQSGNSNAMKDTHSAQVEMLTNLIKMVQGQLEKPVRQKVMSMITMDTHSRDIIEKLQNEGVKNADEFQWQSQLKAYWDVSENNCHLNVADAQFWYAYEYLGNGSRLVVTPLTDRIYVTATQALHLKMGCAPAGPAGTGKTETTKDLACAMGKPCYVFNCSDQMDYRGMGDIFKGLASSGAWGCFDEFNRLIPEVLSVCSVQFRSVTTAIRAKKERFIIQGDEISLNPTCGVFITMNPGYLGRSELPEGLKTLFRPITVVVPDLELICENMLMAEGFVGAKILARKFTTLYALCKDLLSKQAHYDWGLRAIKSVLVVAGGFKRADSEIAEDALLMRALRDFNTPKIVADDVEIFFGLLDDLFPGINIDRKRDMQLEEYISQAADSFNYYKEEEFIKKVVQLYELLEIRHCVFIMGNPGSGKSSTWKTLAKAQEKAGKKTTYIDINPKSVSTNELYGFVNLSTREWRDGLLSKSMRSLGEIKDTNPKWLVMDGDLDTNWIESMNSVMDDNKLLTLASNERIPLKPHMRMLFELRDLVYATPATVSRAGILYISDTTGYQWKAYVNSWIQSRAETMEKDDVEKLEKLFDRYITDTLKEMKTQYKFPIPVVDIQLVISLCKLLEQVLIGDIKGLEYLFVFSCVWALGAGLAEKDGIDYRREFSSWWKNTFKVIKYPNKGTVFDYYVDRENSRLEEWTKILPSISYDSTTPMSEITVPTPETESSINLMNSFMMANHPPLLVGSAGCGKTQTCKGLLNRLNPEKYTYTTINFNYYTDAPLLQTMLEKPLEKKAGKQFGPPAKLKLIYFIDDMNMPQLDSFNTQSAIALLRQQADYQHWYDRNKLITKEIQSTQFLASMNPTAGSFFVNPRLQRHFWLMSVPFPEQSSLYIIYNTFMTGHFKKFKQNVLELVSPLIKSALSLHSKVVKTFRKTAINFHYEFNIRHISNIFQGLLIAQPAQFQDPEKLIRLWIHESERIYGDRLVTKENLVDYRKLMAEIAKASFSRFNLQKYTQSHNPELLIFANFANGLQDKAYDQFENMNKLNEILDEALKEYNDLNAIMDLVLFEDALKHVCRISRIIANPGGHALLVGVGGSGKQSLSRLSSFICGYSTIQIMISSSYGVNDLKNDLQSMYNKSGLKDEGILFLFTEGQIKSERFLVFINDLLSSGEVADLYQPEDKDTIVNNIRPAVKSAGILDNRENCWNFFINRVKMNLHMGICFSPVGDNFRTRARKFPALVNCTVIDWFQDWPPEALENVADKFLREVEFGVGQRPESATDEATEEEEAEMAAWDEREKEIRKAVVKFMPFSFQVVNEQSSDILNQEKRYVYTTPKSFLELIKLFKTMLGKKRKDLEDAKERYEDGVIKLEETGKTVSVLEADLKVIQVEVEEKRKTADEQAKIVGKEKTVVEAENEKANVEAIKCAEIKKNVEAKQAIVQKELDEALPLVEKAKSALNSLKLDEFRTMKAYANPPVEIKDVFICVVNLLATIESPDVIATDKKGRPLEATWNTAKKLMGNPQHLLENLMAFKELIDKGMVPNQNFDANKATINDEKFTFEIISKKSSAAGGLCEWVRNITLYHQVVEEVEPKKAAVKEATEQLREATEKKEAIDQLVDKLKADLSILEREYETAMKAKEDAENEAARCERKLGLAQRLVNALGSENERWQNSIEVIGQQLKVIIGDALLASSFVSYIGPFTKKFRDAIITNYFMPYLIENKIPMSEECNPVSILTDEAQIAEWNNQGLPADKVSVENGAILMNSERYPLIIDPQLQGIGWIKKKEENNTLQITRLTNPKMVTTMERSIEAGYPVLLENMDEQIDAVLAPVYGRAFIRKGKSKYLKMGDKELLLSNEFKLFMHTKFSNPHYPPEIQAETTLINFTVTEAGLEDQLLDLVVKMERPDLAKQKEELIRMQNENKIKLNDLEKKLLYQLSNAKGDFLEDVELIENLETSKKSAEVIAVVVKEAKETEVKIVKASENYRPAASRGALIFFLLNELYKIHSFYMYSLESFVVVVKRAIKKVADAMNPKKEIAEGVEEKEEKKEPAEGEGEEAEGEEKKEKDEEEELEQELTPRSLNKRVDALTESITSCAFSWTRRGLFEKHKLLVSTMLCFRILVKNQVIDPVELDHLIKGKLAPETPHHPEQLRFLTSTMWAACKALEQISRFNNFCQQMENEMMQWKKWYSEDKAESVDLPKTYKDLDSFRRLLLLRAMRPDRLASALYSYVNANLGEEYTDNPPFDMEETYTETSNQTPILFVLFPGVDPLPEVERLGEKLGKTAAADLFRDISMGQGQEDIAEKALEHAAEKGGWIMLQNIHLMERWLKSLERKLEIVTEKSHEDFRCFLSSEPPPLPEMKIIPESILQNCIKVANEAPQSLQDNLKRAFRQFGPERFEAATKPVEFKALAFGLCVYHALILGRRKFGSQGWSRHYNFNDGDLSICGDVLHNYLSKYEKVPYADLRYIYGEIMYGGHITDDWDRRTNSTYLLEILRPELLTGMSIGRSFKCPDPTKYDREQYKKFIEEKLPNETPTIFGMHSNAEIGYLTVQGETLFNTIMTISGGTGGGAVKKKDDIAKEIIVRFMADIEKKKEFNLMELNSKIKVKEPFIVVALQECERMNNLLFEIKRSLTELDAGYKGQLNITDQMETLSTSLSLNQVPGTWAKIAYWSKKSLVKWFEDLQLRIAQLETWMEKMERPKSLWISGLFNPMSYLTAIMQVTAREQKLPLDYICLQTDVTNYLSSEEIPGPPANGAYVHGLFLEGASWQLGSDDQQGYLDQMKPRELHPQIPVVNVIAVPIEKRPKLGMYECPCYMTSMRGPTYVFSGNLKMESEDFDEKYWILAGVAMLMSDD